MSNLARHDIQRFLGFSQWKCTSKCSNVWYTISSKHLLQDGMAVFHSSFIHVRRLTCHVKLLWKELFSVFCFHAFRHVIKKKNLIVVVYYKVLGNSFQKVLQNKQTDREGTLPIVLYTPYDSTINIGTFIFCVSALIQCRFSFTFFWRMRNFVESVNVKEIYRQHSYPIKKGPARAFQQRVIPHY